MRSAHGERCRDRPSRGQSGVLAGTDGLLFAVLILFAGSLFVLHVWATIDTRAALDAAAREYLRTYTEQPDPVSAATAAEQAARDLLTARGGSSPPVRIVGPPGDTFGPCSEASVTLRAELPPMSLPFLDDLPGRSVEVVHTELVDPHRDLATGAAYDPEATPCASS